jgi:hypothetical protein
MKSCSTTSEVSPFLAWCCIRSSTGSKPDSRPVMGIRLHQRPIFSPALPPARGNMRNVMGMALCPALEVVAADE